MKKGAHTDVIVLGGGSSGVAAAVGAAKAGLNVTLVERNSYLGGVATAAEVGTVCGLYKFSKSETAEYIVGQFARDFAESLRAKSGTDPLQNSYGLHFLPYQIGEFKNTCTDLLNKYGVKLLLNTELRSVKRSGTKLESVSMNTGSESFRVPFNSLIDCSGNGLVSQLADLPVIESHWYQAAAQVFSLEGVNETNEAKLGFVLMKALRSAINEKTLADYFDRVYVVPGSLKGSAVSLKIGIPIPVTHKSGNLCRLRTTAHSLVQELTEYLTNHVPLFETARLSHIAPQVGVRVGLRTMGKYVLTEEDVLAGRKFDDAVADVSWPIEEWEQDKRVKMHFLKEDDFYQIPARCLQSKTIDNLFTAGRCLSATNSAIASARVMGVCLQTGYAAGCLAAANALNLSPAHAIKAIQEEDPIDTTRY